MQDVTITIPGEKIKDALNSAAEEVFKSSYCNPFVDVIQEEVKKQDGAFREMFTQILGEIMTNQDFKRQLGEIAMQSLVSKALGK
jgi:hypothetical protein